MPHNIRNPGLIVNSLTEQRCFHTYTEIMVSGMTPQLPINDGLTILDATLLSRVHKASWYIYRGQLGLGICEMNSYPQKELTGLCRTPVSAFLGSLQIFRRDMVSLSSCSGFTLLSHRLATIELLPRISGGQSRIGSKKSRYGLITRA